MNDLLAPILVALDGDEVESFWYLYIFGISLYMFELMLYIIQKVFRWYYGDLRASLCKRSSYNIDL